MTTTEELACHDASCAPPPVGTGGSKPGKGRLSPRASERRLSPSGRDIAGLDRTTAMRAFDVDVGDGVRFETQSARWLPQRREWEIEGNVHAYSESDRGYDSPQIVGSFVRTIKQHDDGTISVEHEYLRLDEDYQGQGYAQRFNDKAMEFYESIGVDRITVHAAMSHGPFAWARQGYRYDETKNGFEEGEGRTRHAWVADRIETMRTYVRMRHEDGDVNDNDARAIDRELVELKNASRSGEDVQPIHIASFGEGDNRVPMERNNWLGKLALVNDGPQDAGEEQMRGYEAVYYLEPRIPAAVASAAARLGLDI